MISFAIILKLIGVSRASSISFKERWVDMSNSRIFSNSSPSHSNRIGISDETGKISRISPLLLHSPSFSTKLTFLYPSSLNV